MYCHIHVRIKILLLLFCSISSIRHGISDLTSNGTITKCVVTHLHTACRIMPTSFQANIHQKLKGKKPRHYRPSTWDLSVGFALCWRRAYASSPHVASEIGYPEKINRGQGPGRPSTVLDRTKGTPVVVLDSHWHGPPTSTSHLSITPPPYYYDLYMRHWHGPPTSNGCQWAMDWSLLLHVSITKL